MCGDCVVRGLLHATRNDRSSRPIPAKLFLPSGATRRCARPGKGLDLNIALTALRQWGDEYLSEKPPRLQLRKVDKKPVVAAIVPKGTRSLRPDEIETRPGPGLTTRRARRKK